MTTKGAFIILEEFIVYIFLFLNKEKVRIKFKINLKW